MTYANPPSAAAPTPRKRRKGMGTAAKMGLLLFTGELTQLNIEAQQALDSVGLNIFGEL